MDDELEELRARVLKLEQVVGALVRAVDIYMPRNRWMGGYRYYKPARAQLDQAIAMIVAPPAG
jgi:hypothetical protein